MNQTLNAAPNGDGETLVKIINADSTTSFLYTDKNGAQTTFNNPVGTTAPGVQSVYAGFDTTDPLYLAYTTAYPNGYSINYTYNTYTRVRTHKRDSQGIEGMIQGVR